MQVHHSAILPDIKQIVPVSLFTCRVIVSICSWGGIDVDWVNFGIQYDVMIGILPRGIPKLKSWNLVFCFQEFNLNVVR